jgi:DNA-binding response OmpR family regulator
VAEDDNNFRLLISEVLQGAGHTPITEPNGLLAWERLQKEGADMILTDVNMPEMDGFQLLKKIRTSANYCKIPVMMLTIRAFAEDQIMGYDTGADDYLSKPFDNGVLVARITVLERRILKRGN